MRHNRIRTYVPVLMTIALLSAVSACSGGGPGTESAQERLTVAVEKEAPTYDPIVSPQVDATAAIRNVFETLVTVDSKFNVKPMLAKSYKVRRDGKAVEFVLRAGVRFHDGTTMKADDVVASMNRWIRHSSAGQAAVPHGRFVKKSDSVVELKMKNRNSLIMLDLAYSDSNLPAIMPSRIANRAVGNSVKEYIGTGPFKFIKWNKGSSLELERFDNYSPRKESPDALAGNRTAAYKFLTYEFVADSATRMSGLETGQYDIITDVPLDNVDRLEAQGLTVKTTPKSGLPNIFLNKAKGTFTNLRARQAIAVGVDREKLMKAGWFEPRFYDPSAGFMPKSLNDLWKGSQTGDNFKSPDIARARQLLKQSGYSGQQVTLLTSKETQNIYDQTIVLQQQLKKIGINSKISTFDYATMLAHRDNPNAWDIIIVQAIGKIEPTQQTFLRPDFPGWTKDPELDTILAKLRGAPDLEGAKRVYQELDRWYQDFVPVVNIGSGADAYATSENVRGANAEGGVALTVWGVTFK